MRGRPNGGHGTAGPGYVCQRCGKPGHFVNRCPTNGDEKYDKQKTQANKLFAVSTGSKKKVTSLDNIDTKSNTVNIICNVICNMICSMMYNTHAVSTTDNSNFSTHFISNTQLIKYSVFHFRS